MADGTSINVYAKRRLQDLEEEESGGRRKKRKKNPATGRDMYSPEELRANSSNPYKKPRTGR